MKTAIILDTALVTTQGSNREIRINQYLNGFAQITEIVKKYSDIFDLYFVDNTVENPADLDPSLLIAIGRLPNLKAKELFFDNESGSKNKGCGVIAAWRRILPQILGQGYEYVIHFEPRQKIQNLSFFEIFLNNPGSYFKTVRRHPTASMIDKYIRPLFPPYDIREVMTGLFSCPPQVLAQFARTVDITSLVENNRSMEKDFYNFLIAEKVPFTPIQNLGLEWQDPMRNSYVRI